MRWPHRTSFLAGCMLLAATAFAEDAADAGDEAVGTATAPVLPPPPGMGDDIYLDVHINGMPTHTIAQFRLRDGQLRTPPGELHAVGIRTEDLPTGTDGLIALDAVPGLRYHYDVHNQQAMLTVADSRRIANALGAGTRPRVAPISGTGLLLNYEAFLQPTTLDGGTSLAIFSEQRAFHPGGVFANTGTLTVDVLTRRYLRLDTNWTHTDTGRLRTLVLGDTLTSALAWSRAVRLGGVQWRRNFSLRPDLVTYPLPVLRGSAAVPTAVDLYVNNVRQMSGHVGDGPFVINTAPAITGAGQAVIVVKDALGRDVTTTVPLYVDTRLLGRGLTDYGIETGFVRNRYAVQSFDYARTPALNASARHGAREWLTLEGHAEAARGVANAGGGAMLRLGQRGVATAAASASHGGSTTGAQAMLGYRLQTPALSLDVQGVRTFGAYRDLAGMAGAPFLRSQVTGTVSVPLAGRGSIAASYVGLTGPATGGARVVSLSYTRQLGRALSLIVNAYQDLADARSRGVLASLSMTLGTDTSAGMTAGMDAGRFTGIASVVRTAPYAGGTGWQLQANQAGPERRSLAQVNHRGRYGDAFAAVQEINGRTSTALDAAGSVVAMDGTVLAGRRIVDAFAVVRTEGATGVPVTHENRAVGKTDARGVLLVPDLAAYQNNRIAIDTLALPINTRVPVNLMTLAPSERAGVLARFHIETYQGAQLRLVDAQGEPLPTGRTVVRLMDGVPGAGGTRHPIGYDGLVFIDDLDAEHENVLRAEGLDPPCTVRFTYPQDAGALPTLGPLICTPDTPEPPR